MNVAEGMKRLAIATGTVCAVAACFATYSDIVRISERRENAAAFHRFKSSPLGRSVQKAADLHFSDSALAKRIKAKLPEYGDMADAELAKRIRSNHQSLSFSNSSLDIETAINHPANKYNLSKPSIGDNFDTLGPTSVEIELEGVRVARLDSKGQIDEVVLSDNTISNGTGPAAWEFAVPLSFPLIGFLLPFGILMGIRWILTGFFPGSSSVL